MREDASVLTKAIIDLATDYGRYGYRRVTALLHRQGWQVNHKRVDADLAKRRFESASETT